ncbi:MAG: hypothetical protein Q7T87_15010 [Polaromonas sp.]|nr:hypothetical protein [Polaromonas sp.]
MDFDKSKTFPYPVLRPYSDDYKDVEFQATTHAVVQGSTVELSCTYLTSCTELIDEIKKSTALYCSVVSCRDTYFRQAITSKTESIKASFDATSLRGEVRIESYIVCIKKISGFMSPDINSEFGKAAFTFVPGQVLAQDETAVIYIDRDLFKPLTSVFDLVKSEGVGTNEWKVSLDDDHVQIQVSPSMKEAIDDARNSTSSKAILLNSLYSAAVTEALHKLKESPDHFSQTKWGNVLVRQLEHNNVDITTTEPYVAAQILMRHPLGVLRAHIFQGPKV